MAGGPGIAVGRYSPTDFSFSAKARVLLSNWHFLATALAVTLSVTATALIVLEYRGKELWRGVGTFVLTLVLIATLVAVDYMYEFGYLLRQIIVALPLSTIVVWGIAIANASKPRGSRTWNSLALLMCAPALIAAGAALFAFGTAYSDPRDGFMEYAVVAAAGNRAPIRGSPSSSIQGV